MGHGASFSGAHLCSLPDPASELVTGACRRAADVAIALLSLSLSPRGGVVVVRMHAASY